jgi:hypothetical protein
LLSSQFTFFIKLKKNILRQQIGLEKTIIKEIKQNCHVQRMAKEILPKSIEVDPETKESKRKTE